MKLTPGVSIAATDSGAIVLDEGTGAMVHLNPSGYGCLQAALDGNGVEAAAWLESTYRLDPGRARHDAHQLLRELQERGLLA
ncbi:PqqD family peptide modification chaperone [Nocardiopsis sp. CA-288880]|uniref:PqqD family peptide modification chaperone n=1 Tax=Nocardiopsis sp. CA-288880 TaxID=3239995 RepID=UPI003D96DB4C